MPNQAAGQGTTGNPATVGANQFRATLTDANQQQTVFELDARHQVIAQTDALTRTTTIARDAAGNPTSITRPNGAVTTMTYDAQRNLLTSTEQALYDSHLLGVPTMSIQAVGHPLGIPRMRYP